MVFVTQAFSAQERRQYLTQLTEQLVMFVRLEDSVNTVQLKFSHALLELTTQTLKERLSKIVSHVLQDLTAQEAVSEVYQVHVPLDTIAL